MILLKNGFQTSDPRLDRLVQFDERSRAYPIMATIEATKPRSYTWRCPVHLDQGREGACCGFAVAHEIAARPAMSAVDVALALRIYKEAQKRDQWPGEAYSGTSVIAAVQYAHELGYYSEYRWAFGISDLVMAVGYKGPAILGINWKTGMMTPDSNGYIHYTGNVEGGHAILCNRVDLKRGRAGVHNSWDVDWGIGGDAWISLDDLSSALQDQGEACIPVKRHRV